MVIYTNNLAEKLFGFAMSRDQLRNTGLCSILEDPNLQLDIDLAIDFNAAVRGDEDAAERFTNTFILSSAFLDYSTVDFYTTRMEQYPVFEYQVDRITYIFDNLDSNDYYAAASAQEKNFLDNLKNALKDCLNSPCNLFAESSESIASIIDNVAASNTTTNLSFSAVKDKTETFFRTTYGGIKNTLIKQLPDAVTGTIGKMAILGQDAWDQSVDIIFEKDTEKKDKLIANALAGRALDYEATGYTYIPDIDAITSLEGFASSVLSQAASDLGGCFRKYQHLARYSQFDEEQNLSRTSTTPVQDSVDGKVYQRNTSGVTPVGSVDREKALNCDYGLADPDVAPPGSYLSPGIISGEIKTYVKDGVTYVDKDSLREYIGKRLIGSPILNKKFEGMEAYGIRNGNINEWTNFFVSLAKNESAFEVYEINSTDPGGSYGIFQVSNLEATRNGNSNPLGFKWELNAGEYGFYNPAINTHTAITMWENSLINKKPRITNSTGRGAEGSFAASTMERMKNELSR